MSCASAFLSYFISHADVWWRRMAESLIDFLYSQTHRGHKVWVNQWTCCINLYLICVLSAAMIPCLSMAFQETRPWQQTRQGTPQGNILCLKHVLCFYRHFSRLNQLLGKKGILSLLSVPGKMKLPQGKKTPPRPPFYSTKLPFISLEPCPLPLSIKPNFAPVSAATHSGLAIL